MRKDLYACLRANKRQVREALAEIAEANDGCLYEICIVNAARDPFSPLHQLFDWTADSRGLWLQASDIVERAIPEDELHWSIGEIAARH